MAIDEFVIVVFKSECLGIGTVGSYVPSTFLCIRGMELCIHFLRVWICCLVGSAPAMVIGLWWCGTFGTGSQQIKKWHSR